MADVTPLRSTDQTAQTLARPIIASVQWQNLWTAASGIAGAAGIVYATGAAIEALRLHKAGLPVEQAISVVPRTALFALAVNALLLPAIIIAAFGVGSVLWTQQFTEREPDPKKQEQKLAKQRERQARREARIRSGRVRNAMRRLLTPAYAQVARPAWSATFGRLSPAIQGWAAFGVIYVLFLPWTPTGLVPFVFGAAQFWMIGHIARHRAMRTISRRREAVLFGVVAGLTISASTMAREIIDPGPLPLASVKVVGQKKETRGMYIATTPEGVYLGVDRRLVLIPDRLADKTNIWNAPEQKPEKGETLLSRIE